MKKVFFTILYLGILVQLISNPKPNTKAFGPSETKGSGANWQILQTPEGYIFSASSAGIKFFDGYTWSVIKNRLNSEMYSLDADNKNCIIYCGGLEDFGFLELDDHNQFTYYSLFNLLPSSQLSFGKIWQTVVLENIYFLSNKFIFEFDGNKIIVHKAENNTFYKAFTVKNKLLVQEEGIGLFLLEKNKKVYIKNSEKFNDKLIEYILEIDGHLKLFFSDGIIANCNLIENNLIINGYETNEVSKLIKDDNLLKVLLLYDDNYAFALSNTGIIITDKNFKIQYVFNEENNIINERINDIYEDYFGNIWTAGDNTIRFINYGSPYSIFNNNDGLKGIVSSFIEVDGKIIFSDQFNIYSIFQNKLVVLHKLNESIREILSIDRSTYFVLTNKALYIVNHGDIKKLLDISEAKGIFNYDKETQIYGIFTGNQFLFFSLKEKNARIEYVKIIDQVELNNVAVDRDKRIWFSTVSSGVGYYHQDKFKFYDSKSGIDNYFNNKVVFVKNQIYILSQNGILKPDKHLSTLRITSDFGEYFRDAFVTNITETESGFLIKLNNVNNINEYYLINEYLTPDSDFNKLFRYLPERGFAGWYLSSDDKLYISFIENLFVMDVNKVHRLYQPLNITVQQILYNERGYFDSKKQRIVLNYDHGPLQIFVTSPYFEGQEKISYFFRITNQSNEWQEIKNSNKIFIPRLNFGDFEIQIYARNIYGINSDITKIPIKVRTPWYLSIYFIIFIFLCIFFLFYLIQRFRDNILEKRNKELEQIIQLRTKELLEEKRELERSKEELFELSKQKNQLLGVYAHDLKNPISAIDGIKDLLDVTISTSELDTTTKKEVSEYLSMIKSSTNQMMAIIQDILSSVKQEAFKQKIEKKILDINEILSEHYALMNSYALQKNIKVYFEPKGKLMVNVDERKIGEVFQNLISNAIKYSPENSEVHLMINIESRNSKEYVKISIKDQGPGFTEEDKKKMFGLFQRLSAKPTKGESSTGLGLYIVKNYTELNEGFVELDSEYGKGSTFHIFLPLVEKII